MVSYIQLRPTILTCVKHHKLYDRSWQLGSRQQNLLQHPFTTPKPPKEPKGCFRKKLRSKSVKTILILIVHGCSIALLYIFALVTPRQPWPTSQAQSNYFVYLFFAQALVLCLGSVVIIILGQKVEFILIPKVELCDLWICLDPLSLEVGPIDLTLSIRCFIPQQKVSFAKCSFRSIFWV